MEKICKHFDICGGCRFQDIEYEQQLKNKEKTIKDLLAQHEISCLLKPINHFNPWYYRNKMEFTFAQREEKVICGMHSKINKREVFNLEECLIFSEVAQEIVPAIVKFANDKGYCAYNKRTHKGFFRHLIIRETKFTDQIMIGLVVSGQEQLDKEEFLNLLKSFSCFKKIKSVYLITNDSFGDAVTFEKKEVILGESFIIEKLKDIEFAVTIDSFFQPNAVGIINLYDKLVSCLAEKKINKLLDLYCGVGSISLFLSPHVEFIWAVEIIEAAVKKAQANAERNQIKNISFICDDSRKFLAKTNLHGKIDAVVLNPPRCGLSKKVKKRVLELQAPYICYSSCNPKSFCDDLASFLNDYRPEFIEPFDFFPHTPHMEVFSFLKRK